MVKISILICFFNALQCIYVNVRKTNAQNISYRITNGKDIDFVISGKSFGHEWLSVSAGWVSVTCYRLLETIINCFTFSYFYCCCLMLSVKDCNIYALIISIHMHFIGRGAPHGFTSSPHNGVEDPSYPGPVI